MAMVKAVTLPIPRSRPDSEDVYFEDLHQPIKLPDDAAQFSSWVFQLPRKIFSVDLTQCHVFARDGYSVQEVPVERRPACLKTQPEYFVMTRANGLQLYCTAQNYYVVRPTQEETPLRHKSDRVASYLVPKCLVFLSELPYFQLHVNLHRIYAELASKETSVTRDVYESLYQCFLEHSREEWEVLKRDKTLREGKCLRQPTSTMLAYYLHCCASPVDTDTCLVDPVTEAQILYLYRLDPVSPFQISFLFRLPLEAQSLLLVMSALLQEYQIVFISPSMNLLTSTLETLLQMLLPLKWYYMYVPNMPSDFIEAAVENFQPFLIGVHPDHRETLEAPERVFVDLSSGQVQYPPTMAVLPTNFLPLLTFANKRHNYLNFEVELRCKGLLLVTTLLEDARLFLASEKPKPASSKKLLGSVNNLSKLSYESLLRKFARSSMLYSQFVEKGEARTIQSVLALPPERREAAIKDRLEKLAMRSRYPQIIDNEEKWLQYYHREVAGKHERLKRRSLNVSHAFSSSLSKSTVLLNGAVKAPSQSTPGKAHLAHSSATHNVSFFHHR